MEQMSTEIAALKVSEENFSKFGKVIAIPEPGEKKPILESDFFKHYGPLAFLNCESQVEFGITTFKKRPLSLSRLEQHAKTPEFLYAIDGPFILPVAAIIDREKTQYPDEKSICAYLVPQGVGIVFDTGIWHWAPFPYEKEVSSVLVGFNKGTAQQDIVVRDLQAKYTISIQDPRQKKASPDGEA